MKIEIETDEVWEWLKDTLTPLFVISIIAIGITGSTISIMWANAKCIVYIEEHKK